MNKKTHLPLTKRESDILVYILGYIEDNGYSPTRGEIAEYLNNQSINYFITQQGVNYFINQLVAKNKLKLIANKKRNLKIHS